MKFVLAVSLLLLFALSNVICPEHGVKSAFTGNKKFADKRTYCEYEHPYTYLKPDKTGNLVLYHSVHKFWSPCG